MNLLAQFYKKLVHVCLWVLWRLAELLRWWYYTLYYIKFIITATNKIQQILHTTIWQIFQSSGVVSILGSKYRGAFHLYDFSVLTNQGSLTTKLTKFYYECNKTLFSRAYPFQLIHHTHPIFYLNDYTVADSYNFIEAVL